MKPLPRAWRVGAGAAALAAGVALAQDSQPDPGAPAGELPAAAELFRRHVEAVGGAEALFAIKSRRMEGSMTVRDQGIAARIEYFAWAPSSMLMRLEQPGGVTFETGFDGAVGWNRVARGQDGQGGPAVPLDEKELLRRKDRSGFYGEATYEQRYKELETLGRSSLANRPVYKVRAVSNLNVERTVYFDTVTGLVVGVAFTERAPDGAQVTTTQLFGDYRPIGRVKWPAKLTIIQGGVITELKFSGIEFDPQDMPQLVVPEEIRAAAEPPPETTGGSPADRGEGGA